MNRQWWERDDIWGWVLIAAGIVAVVWRPFEQLDDALHEQGARVLTLMLLAVAALAILTAFSGSNYGKARMLAWMVLP